MERKTEKRCRRTWGRQETLAFLNCYMKRKEEFETPRKKKSAFSNVLEDLTSRGVLEQPTTDEMLESKIKSLLKAYKASKDAEMQTGASPCEAPFQAEMDEIFGSKPIISGGNHVLNLRDVPVNHLVEASTSVVATDASSCNGASTSGVASNTPQAPKKRKTPRQLYMEQMLRLKADSDTRKFEQRAKLYREMEANNERRFKLAEEAKQKRHEEKLLLLSKLIAEK